MMLQILFHFEQCGLHGIKKSQCYKERVQILTLSPFSIERTVKEFQTTNYLVKKKKVVS